MCSKKKTRGRILGVLAVGLIWLLSNSTGLQAAGRISGAKVRVIAGQASEWVTGELVGVRSDAVIMEIEKGQTRTISLKDISSVQILHKSAVLAGVVIGGSVGGGVGFALRPKVKDETNPLEAIFIPLGGVLTVAAGVAVGALTGAVAGSALVKDKTYDLTKMSAAEVGEFTAKLRKMARVKNYQ